MSISQVDVPDASERVPTLSRCRLKPATVIKTGICVHSGDKVCVKGKLLKSTSIGLVTVFKIRDAANKVWDIKV